MSRVDTVTDFVVDREEYTVRWFEPDDRDDFVSLYSSVYGAVDEGWFEWKYEDVPYVDRVPIIVVEHGGTVVGTRPNVAVPLRAGDETLPALQQVDLIVHPDHRRRGLFTHMVEWMYEFYESGREALTFTFANGPSRRGYEKMDAASETSHSYLGTFSRYERIQSPNALAGNASRSLRVGTRAVSPFVRAYLAGRDRLARRRDDFTVRRHGSPPVDVLVRLYARDVPDAVHVARGESFYRWRFASPGRSFVTYVASEGPDPVAAVVVCRWTIGGVETIEIDEVLPMAGGRERTAALSALLSRVVEDHRSADRITAAGDSIPDAVLRAHGFVSSSSFPLSRVVDPTYLVARPLGDLSAVHPRLDEWLSAPERWHQTYCVRNLG